MKLRRMIPTKIEYGDLGWNFYPGCLHKPQGKCPVPSCWAEGMWKRHMAAEAKKGITLPDFHHPHLVPELLLAPLSVRKPSTILVNFMGDIGGSWVDPAQDVHFHLPDGREAVDKIGELVLTVITSRPEHTFLFLTKNPAGLVRWGEFPDNAWVGATVCNQKMFDKALIYLSDVKAKHKWLSIEPLSGEIKIKLADLEGISWVVIGAQTQPQVSPRIEWVEGIVLTVFAAGIPVWLKNNLYKLLMEAEDHDLYFEDMSTLRQERPERKAIV